MKKNARTGEKLKRTERKERAMTQKCRPCSACFDRRRPGGRRHPAQTFATMSSGLFGQVIIGPPGSGKTTYCHGMQQFLTAMGRCVSFINVSRALFQCSSALPLTMRAAAIP